MHGEVLFGSRRSIVSYRRGSTGGSVLQAMEVGSKGLRKLRVHGKASISSRGRERLRLLGHTEDLAWMGATGRRLITGPMIAQWCHACERGLCWSMSQALAY